MNGRPAPRLRSDTRGLLLMVASAACFAAMAPFTQKWLKQAPTQTIVFARAVVMTLVFGGYAWLRGLNVAGHDRPRLILRGLLGYAAITCYVWSTQHIPVSHAVLIQYSHPVFVAALAPALLNERTGPLHWPLVLAASAGLVVVVILGAPQDPAGALHGAAPVASGTLIGFTGALLSGLAYMTVRNLARVETPLAIVFWFSVVMLPGSFAGVLHAGAQSLGAAGTPIDGFADLDRAFLRALPQTDGEWFGLWLVVAAGLVGQITLTEGLARAGAARAVAVTMAGPLFGVVFDYLFFDKRPTLLSLGGTLLVVAALTTLAWLKPTPAVTEGELE